jgi:GMP synthase (glutamine-hydrolysing)
MFKPEKFIEAKIPELQGQIKGKAVIACSGGVDSTVAAAIVSKAIGDRLVAIFVDTGYLRKGEPESVCKMLGRMGINYRLVDAGAEFYAGLKGVIHPEEKRKVIGAIFIRIFERAAKEAGSEYLIQGTIAPDWIESGGELRDVIKSHHNVGGLPEKMNLKLIEPLRDLYKDDVRKVARHMGLEIAEKQPFP